MKSGWPYRHKNRSVSFVLILQNYLIKILYILDKFPDWLFFLNSYSKVDKPEYCTYNETYSFQAQYDEQFFISKMLKLHRWCNGLQGFQYFSSLPVLYYLQTVLFNKIWTIFHEYLIQHSLKSGGTKDHFRWVKVPGTATYWKAWVSMLDSSAVDHGLKPQSGQMKDYKIGICCFSAKHAA